jgi:hypothetical protein
MIEFIGMLMLFLIFAGIISGILSLLWTAWDYRKQKKEHGD